MKISIITATFNSGKTVRDTLESVLHQTHKDIELIIKDGGSKDNTLDICREYEPRFEGRMKIISSPDKGIYDAMNQGIAAATGDVVGILNSDDFYAGTHVLQRVVEAFVADASLQAVYGDIHYCRWDSVDTPVRYYSSKGFRPWKMLLGWMPAHPSFYCRRAVYEQYGAFDSTLRVAADFENVLRLIYVNRIKTQYLPIDFVTMREGGASSSGVQSHRTINREHQIAFKKNGVRSNIVIESFRYLSKIAEVVASKMVYRH